MKYKELIAAMTLEEKASLMSGQNFWNTKSVDRLGIPSMMLTDGPHGLRKQGGEADNLGLHDSIPATCFPTAATLANSWDISLLESVGACIGREAAAHDVSVLLGPGLNIKRDPLCGRNFEYYSEDPFLTGKLAASFIRGVQSEGVSACPKHFAVNSQEDDRMIVDEVVDERALREIYLEGFRYAVTEGGAKAIMTSYNRVNGTYANEHPHLLQDILYGEWEFGGMVVTDWGGSNDRVEGLINGCSLEMPSTSGMTDREVVEAVRDGRVDEAVLDERVDSLLELLYSVRPTLGKGKRYTDEIHNDAARDAARRSFVLLKNEKGLLPLAKGKRVAVIGDFAKAPRYQGSGSSLINPIKLTPALDELLESGLDVAGYEPGFKRSGGRSASFKRRAVRLAASADVAVLFLGLNERGEAEGFDRKDLCLPDNQIELLSAIRKVCSGVVVVLSCGAPVETEWAHMADAVLHTYLGGQASGSAVADILTGRVNPSGKLAETYPVKYEDTPAALWYHKNPITAEHRESIFVGYRYYDSLGINVAWPFGFGLSYTSFEYCEMSADTSAVEFTVCNTGEVAGEEVSQVYVAKVGSSVFRAKKELKGFVKTALEPGERKTVRVDLDEHAFTYFCASENAWVCEPGEYRVMVGSSSRDIRLEAALYIDGEATAAAMVAAATQTAIAAADTQVELAQAAARAQTAVVDTQVELAQAAATQTAAADTQVELAQAAATQTAIAAAFSENDLPHYYKADAQNIPDSEFEILLGRSLPPGDWEKGAPLSHSNTISQAQSKKGFGRLLYRSLKLVQRFCYMIGKKTTADYLMFVASLRFNQLARMSGGKIDMPMLDGLLIMVNGKFWRGLRHIRHMRKFRK